MIRKVVGVAALSLLTVGCGMYRSGQQSNGAASAGMSGSSTPPPSVSSAAPLPVTRDTVKHIQSTLQQDGLYSGPIDGIIGPQTRAALASYQQRQGQSPSAALDQHSLQALLAGQPSQASGSSMPPANGQSGKMSENQIRSRLQSEGYSDVSDIRPYGNDAYTAKATKNGQSQTIEIDGRTGQATPAQ